MTEAVGWLCGRCGLTGESPAPARCPRDKGRVVPDMRGRWIDGRYRVVDLLGLGGMGSAVWRAHQESIRRDVALKLLPESDPEAILRFERGARLASNLNHPHIVTVHDYGRTDDGALYLVMELLRGRELTQLLRARGPLAIDDALRLADQALQALHHAHKHRVVHRDIKPGNLFVTQSDDEQLSLKILDFGIARFFEDDADPGGGLADRVEGDVTTVHKICGTPRYMSPEQINREPVDGRTDLYSLGVVLYQCLTGQPPFDGDLTRLLYSHLHVAPPPLRDIRADIHPLLEAVVLKAMAKQPEGRFATAREMRHTLYDVQHEMGLSVAGPPTGALPALSGLHALSDDTGDVEPPRRRRWWPFLVGFGGMLAVGAWWMQANRLTVDRLDTEPSVWIREADATQAAATDDRPTAAPPATEPPVEPPAAAPARDARPPVAAASDEAPAPAGRAPNPTGRPSATRAAPRPTPARRSRPAPPVEPPPVEPRQPAPDATPASPPDAGRADAAPVAAPAVEPLVIGGEAPAPRVEPLVLDPPPTKVEPLRLTPTGATVQPLVLPTGSGD